MRQGQQNRRGRGRNNVNAQRKGQNPLTRSFESNGPDVKLRGTPAHIAEKYISLARDALSAGDPVLAENYLQHAEHYNRIIMTFRDQQTGQGEGYGGAGLNGHGHRSGLEAGFASDLDAADQMDDPGSGDQPVMTRGPGGEPQRSSETSGYGHRYEDRPQRHSGDANRHQSHGSRELRDRNFQEGGRAFGGERRDRLERTDRPDRQDRDRSERHRPDRPQYVAQGPVVSDPRSDTRHEQIEPVRRRERPAQERMSSETVQQPEFLRRSVRRPRRDDQDDLQEAPAAGVLRVTPEDAGSE